MSTVWKIRQSHCGLRQSKGDYTLFIKQSYLERSVYVDDIIVDVDDLEDI